MKIEKRDRAWWIVQVPPYRVDGVVQTVYGPYDSAAEAEDDLEGLERFFRDHPAFDTVLSAQSEESARTYTRHWFVKSLIADRSRLRMHRQVTSSPGQRTLPGMDQPSIASDE